MDALGQFLCLVGLGFHVFVADLDDGCLVVPGACFLEQLDDEFGAEHNVAVAAGDRGLDAGCELDFASLEAVQVGHVVAVGFAFLLVALFAGGLVGARGWFRGAFASLRSDVQHLGYLG